VLPNAVLIVDALPFLWRVKLNVRRKKTVRYFVGEKRSSKGVNRALHEISLLNTSTLVDEILVDVGDLD